MIYCNFYFRNSSNFHEALVDITAGKVAWQRNRGTKIHAPGTPEEMERMHEVATRSELVKKEIQRLKLAKGTEVVCEPWPYGKDGINDDERLFQVTLNYHPVLMGVLLLPGIRRSQEEASFSQSLCTPS